MLSLGISTQLLKQACGVHTSSMHPEELALLAQRSVGELRAAVLMLLAAQFKVADACGSRMHTLFLSLYTSVRMS